MEWMLMPYKRYADFSGRSRRMEYWMFALLTVIVSIVCVALIFGGMASMEDFATAEETGANPFGGMGVLSWIGIAILVIWGLASIIPSIAVGVRRLHDMNYSGWIYLAVVLLGIIPLVGTLVQLAFIVVMCLPGTKGPNKYGPDPLDPTNASVFE